MRPLKWALIVSDRHHHKKEKFGHAERYEPCRYLGHMRTQKEGSSLQAKRRILRRNHSCRHLDLAPLASRTMRNKFLLFKPCSLWYFVMAVSANWHEHLLSCICRQHGDKMETNSDGHLQDVLGKKLIDKGISWVMHQWFPSLGLRLWVPNPASICPLELALGFRIKISNLGCFFLLKIKLLYSFSENSTSFYLLVTVDTWALS